MTIGRLAIGQPTYLPWLGYFDLIDDVDAFVVLDHVQFERQSWQHRNRVKGPNGEVMLTVPVKRTGLATSLADAEITESKTLRKHFKTIQSAYARAEWVGTADEVRHLFESPPERLVEITIPLIRWMLERLRITTPLLLSSELGVRGEKADLVYSICENLEAQTYVAAPGSKGYLDESGVFEASPIRLTYHEYECVPYQQMHGPFLPYMSAIDAILNLGDAARSAMQAGRTTGQIDG